MAANTHVYDQEYFSGAQMNMYIGDVLIDEVTSLAVQVRQNKVPVYGYADQLFNKVSKGTVLVQGQFTINFKEAGYLYAVLERFKQRGRVNSPFIDTNNFNFQDKTRGGALRDGQRGVLSRQNIEQIDKSVDSITSGTVNGRALRPEEYIEYFQSLTGFNNRSPGRAGSVPGALPGVENVFEAFEDRIWGTDELDRDADGRRGDSNRFDDFTIYATFGDYNRNNRVNHTAKRIDRVHLIGQAQTIMINGEPIAEEYSFIARNFT